MREGQPETSSITVELPRDAVERLTVLAQRTGSDVSHLVSDVVTERLSYLEWKVSAIQDAIDDVDAGGRLIGNEAVLAWLDSWETPGELPPPE